MLLFINLFIHLLIYIAGPLETRDLQSFTSRGTSRRRGNECRKPQKREAITKEPMLTS